MGIVTDYDGWHRHAAEALARGSSTDELLAALRAAGANPLNSMRVLVESTGVGLGEAKQIVWASPVWADELGDQIRLEDEILAALDAEAAQGAVVEVTDDSAAITIDLRSGDK